MDNLRYWFYDSELDDFKKRMKKSKMGLSQTGFIQERQSLFLVKTQRKENTLFRSVGVEYRCTEVGQDRPLFALVFHSFSVIMLSFFQIMTVRNGWIGFGCRVFPH